MKVLILAGGFGTRLSEETKVIPKPMIEIGGRPILWHIMKTYSHYGFNDFVVLCGYKGSMIKQYFADFFMENSSITFDLQNNTMEVVDPVSEPWRVTCLDTGLNTLTGGRVKKAMGLTDGEPFMLTYGDGVCNVNVKDLVENHKASGKAMTMTVIQPEGRFGSVKIEGSNVNSFEEKRKGDLGWINGGYFVCQPEVFDYIPEGDGVILEREPLESLADKLQINAYKHHDFWMCMDTLGDKNRLQELWDKDEAKWKVWS
jgi:glucose-1-phosphate cytidylyltransferase